jgi:hypothetical protein
MAHLIQALDNHPDSDKLSYVASSLNPLKIYRNQVCAKEIQI